MSDSDEEFASADEGDAGATGGENTAKVKAPVAKDTSKEVAKKMAETCKAEKPVEKDRIQSKKKGKTSGKGGRDKAVTKDGSKAAGDAAGKQGPKQEAEGKKKQGKQKSGNDGGSRTQKEKLDKQEQKNVSGKVDEAGDSKPASDIASADNSKAVEKSVSQEKETKSEPQPEKLICDESKVIDNKENSKPNVMDNQEKVVEAVSEPDSNEAASAPDVKTTEANKADLLKSPSSQSISRPEADHSEQQEQVLDKLSAGAKPKASGWGWGWGSSLLDVASSSVSTFTSQVGEGLTTMIESVESTLNVPSPEDMVQARDESQDNVPESESAETDSSKSSKPPAADKPSTDSDQPVDSSENQSAEDAKQSTVEEKQSTETEQQSSEADDQSGGGGWFSSWGVSNITKMVESTSKNLVSGSIDVLETIGKKTFDVINERDPGLKKTRGILSSTGDKPNLSAVIREAKAQDEARAQQEQESAEARKAHFGSLFDDFQGLAHLEALEILSNQSEKRVTTLLGALPPDAIAAIKPQLLEIKANFELDEEDEEDVDEHDLKKLVTDLLAELDVGTSPTKLIQTHEGIRAKLADQSNAEGEEKPEPKVVHQVAIQSLAELTSRSIEQFHKCGEMILLHVAHQSDFVSSSKTLLSLTKTLCAEVGILSTKFTECLNKCTGEDGASSVNPLVTSVYLEASNSSSYIQDGFQLLLPVLQQAAIEKSQDGAS